MCRCPIFVGRPQGNACTIGDMLRKLTSPYGSSYRIVGTREPSGCSCCNVTYFRKRHVVTYRTERNQRSVAECPRTRRESDQSLQRHQRAVRHVVERDRLLLSCFLALPVVCFMKISVGSRSVSPSFNFEFFFNSFKKNFPKDDTMSTTQCTQASCTMRSRIRVRHK